MDEQQRIKDVYSKHTFFDFYMWWEHGKNYFMEIRIKDYLTIKKVAEELKLPYSVSGVYIKNPYELKEVMKRVRSKHTVWFGIQPRKKNWNKWGHKGLGGTDHHVDEIRYIFVDIDRVNKIGPATNEDLKNCDILAEKIIERLSSEGWDYNYAKICSGHGLQLLIRLDIPIKIPECKFDNETKTFINNDEFNKIRRLISQGIGRLIYKFGNQFRDKLGVEIDKSCFSLSRVGALHGSKNFKYNTERWRGIVELKQHLFYSNAGLTDYILSRDDDPKRFKKKDVFRVGGGLLSQDILRPGKLRENVLVNFMLTNDLPAGMRNNWLWFSLKLLLRDSKFDLQSDEFKEVYSELVKRHGDLTLNLPEKRFVFNRNVVNNFCIKNRIPLVYDLWPNKTKKRKMCLEDLDFFAHNRYPVGYNLNSDNTIMEDMEWLKNKLKENDIENRTKVLKFTSGCERKYGSGASKYYFDTLFYKYFTFD